ncbi:DUF4179 domain-containing protein [Paenibacillus sp. 481]|uniref:DUF4179 domain-containing protein n=1 Tax=Paenibacillus sp. 481 TaxID=2835869 RepID=UPI001E2847EC|nr:DUF4179 domain-containing protein [Paenibacillus sp. 481]UHA73491.1 DUF4179 domain-containing protein [Paenibacillus sp. 481]
MTTTTSKLSVLKKTVLIASILTVFGTGVYGAGTGFGTPVMAASASKDSATASNRSVTHDGITLTVDKLSYDGTRLSFQLIRKGVGLPENVASPYIDGEIKATDNEWVRERKVPEKDRVKGYIEGSTLHLLANGEKIKYTAGSSRGTPDNAFYFELTSGLNLPDEFELTIQAKVTKVDEPFEFKIPVKAVGKPLMLKPNTSKSHGKFSYTVKGLHISPKYTRLILDSNGPVPRSKEQTGKYIASKVYYELVDDKGNVLEPNIFGYYHKAPGDKAHVNDLYSPAKVTPKSITIKPFTLTVNPKDWSVKGHSKKSVGDKTYLKELELTIPVVK